MNVALRSMGCEARSLISRAVGAHAGSRGAVRPGSRKPNVDGSGVAQVRYAECAPPAVDGHLELRLCRSGRPKVNMALNSMGCEARSPNSEAVATHTGSRGAVRLVPRTPNVDGSGIARVRFAEHAPPAVDGHLETRAGPKWKTSSECGAAFHRV